MGADTHWRTYITWERRVHFWSWYMLMHFKICTNATPSPQWKGEIAVFSLFFFLNVFLIRGPVKQYLFTIHPSNVNKWKSLWFEEIKKNKTKKLHYAHTKWREWKMVLVLLLHVIAKRSFRDFTHKNNFLCSCF